MDLEVKHPNKNIKSFIKTRQIFFDFSISNLIFKKLTQKPLTCREIKYVLKNTNLND